MALSLYRIPHKMFVEEKKKKKKEREREESVGSVGTHRFFPGIIEIEGEAWRNPKHDIAQVGNL